MGTGGAVINSVSLLDDYFCYAMEIHFLKILIIMIFLLDQIKKKY